MQNLLKNISQDIRVELLDEYGRNFERKAFFDKPWEKRKRNGRGSLLVVSGRLRRSIRANVSQGAIRFSSDTPYASLHNNGGKVTVTPKMRKFFWAMYYKNMQGVTMSIKTKQVAGKQSIAKNDTAEYWKGLALKKRGGHITIPKRQFLGDHPRVNTIVKKVVDERVTEWAKDMQNQLSKLNKR